MASPQIENGHLDLAMELVEKFASFRLSGEEWQVLWVVFRKTYAWHKKSDEISLSQYVTVTGMKRESIRRAIKKLVAKKLLVVIKEGVTYANKFLFNKDFDQWVPGSKKAPSTGSKKAPGGAKKVVL